MKRRQQTTKQRENVSRLGLESDLRGPLGLWVAPINLANDHQLGHMFEEKEGRKKTFWHLGYWKQWMISDQVWRLERGFSQTQHNGNISANDQPWCQKPKTVEPTIQRDPPPPLIWTEGNTHSRHQGSRPSLPAILIHLITTTSRCHCFLSVSSSGSFPKYVPWFWWPLPYSQFIFIFFPFVYRSVKVCF